MHNFLNNFQYSKSKTGCCALKIDIENTFDRVEWNFLWKVLEHLKFQDTWIELLKDV